MRMLAALMIAGTLTGAGLAVAPPAPAQPYLKCSPYVPFVGRWCDSNWAQDGSYDHCLDSWGGLDCSRVCTMEGNPVNPPLMGPEGCGRPPMAPIGGMIKR